MGNTIKLGIQLNSLEEVRAAFNRYILCENDNTALSQHQINLRCSFFRALFDGDKEALEAAQNESEDQPHEGQDCDALLCDKLIYQNSCTFFGSEDDKECDAVDKNFVCTADTTDISYCLTSCEATYHSSLSAKTLFALANSFAEQEVINKALTLCGIEQERTEMFRQSLVEGIVEKLCPDCDVQWDWETFWEQHVLGEPYVDAKEEL